MSIVTPQRKKQQKLISVLLLVFLITSTVLYFGVFRKGKPGAGVTIVEEFPVFPSGPGVIKLDLSLLTQDRFRDLVPYEKLSTDIKTGRKNPFLPYTVSPTRQAEPETQPSFPVVEEVVPIPAEEEGVEGAEVPAG